MKHPLRIVIVAALAVGTLLAFTAGGGLAKSNQDLAAADPIVIAMPLALSGVISFYDKPNLAGAQIAVAEINRKGGVLNRPLKIISADTKSDLGLIAGVANSLLDQGAHVMIPTLDYDFGGPSARASSTSFLPAARPRSAEPGPTARAGGTRLSSATRASATRRPSRRTSSTRGGSWAARSPARTRS
jgi:ABC-type branched-subunit amino acid transport system substrate-binding protein